MTSSNSLTGMWTAAILLLTGALAQSPPLPVYERPLPIPPVKAPRFTINNPVTNQPIQYYEFVITNYTDQVYPDLQSFTALGYDGQYPAPTIIVPKGTESVVRFVNRRTDDLEPGQPKHHAVHLHGSPSRAPFDGWPEDLIEVGQFKDYYYPNNVSARMLWYHDHSDHHTAANVHLGLAGMYIINDPAEDGLNLPTGYGQFDIPLALTSKTYNQQGQLVFPPTTQTDVIEVNGEAWPLLRVQPRKYRLRFLNADPVRAYNLGFFQDNNNVAVPFQMIAGDAGLFPAPVPSSNFVFSAAERYEVVFDFTPFAGANITLRNSQGVFDPNAPVARVMRFMVSADPVEDPSVVPPVLGAPIPPANPGVRSRIFDLNFNNNGEFSINGVSWNDINNRVLANVPRGTIEQWTFRNMAGSNHPLHTHLIDFRVLSRNGRPLAPYEAAGLKDTVWVTQGAEEVVVEARFAPWEGLYLLHCHNLIHEDNAMMAAFNVTRLLDLGYEETDYRDPMDPRWRPRPATEEEMTEAAIRARVEALAREEPYNDAAEVDQRLRDYWATRTTTEFIPTPTPVSGFRRFMA